LEDAKGKELGTGIMNSLQPSPIRRVYRVAEVNAEVYAAKRKKGRGAEASRGVVGKNNLA